MWYLGKNEKPLGPYSYEEIKLKIWRGEVRPSDLVFNSAKNLWQPAQEWRDFSSDLFPCFQAVAIRDFRERAWIVLRPIVEGRLRQDGPFSEQEIKDLLRIGQLTVSDFLWTHGMSGWAKIEDCPVFKRTKIVGNTEINW